jgi:cysteine synthase B
VIDVSQQEATDMSRKLAKTEGIFAGMSTGGALHAAIKLVEELESGVVVFIACDRGDRYLSSDLFG